MTRSKKRRRGSARALCQEVHGTVAVLTRGRDFALMRRYHTFTFRHHSTYLRHTERVLRSLTHQGLHTTVGGFDPEEYSRYCTSAGIDPDSAESRAWYAARLAATGRTVPYTGERIERMLTLLPVVGHDAVDGGGRRGRRTHRIGVGGRFHAGARPGGPVPGQHSFAEMAGVLDRLLTVLGTGSHSLVCSVRTPSTSMGAVLRAECASSSGLDTGDSSVPGRSTVLMDDDEVVRFCAVLTAGATAGCSGGLVVRTSRPGAHDAPTVPTETVRGWSVRTDGLRALSEAQVFAAYCTDPETGEPVPPEPGVRYQPGIEL